MSLVDWYDDEYDDIYADAGSGPPPPPPPPPAEVTILPAREPQGTPHFAYPFRLGPGSAIATVEQDTEVEVTQCVEVLLRTQRGERIEVPDYGIDDLTFQTHAPLTALAAAIEQHEPRASVWLTVSPDRLDEMVRRVQVRGTEEL